jgi:alkylhydroperoxidase/carboxymuconolactone decarboxylase family protein YurZ
MMTTVEDFRRAALVATASLQEGDALDVLAAALVRLGVAVAVTALDPDEIDASVAAAFDAGASIAQVQEVIALVSGLGVHSLMASSTRVISQAASRGLIDKGAPLDAERQALWDACVGDDPFWVGFEQEVPGFLDALVRLSPDIFRGFFDYCAIPWKSGKVEPVLKELIAMASDATPTHRFMPGFKVHLRNAIDLGNGRRAILQALDIAAAAPGHVGVA